MSNTYKTKSLGKRKRTGETTLKTEKMMERKCGLIDDKVEKMELEEKELQEAFRKEIEEITK